MPYIYGRRPVLLMSDRISERLIDRPPSTVDLRDKLSALTSIFQIPYDSEFDARYLTRDEWITLVTQHPSLIHDYMMYPHEMAVLEAMESVPKSEPNGKLFDADGFRFTKDPNRWSDITGRSAAEVIGRFRDLSEMPVRMRALYDPFSSKYLVNLSRNPDPEKSPSEPMIRGAWQLSGLGSEEREVQRLISDERIVNAIVEGARILYLPAGAVLDHPRPVAVERRVEGKSVVTNAWTPDPGQTERRGSAISLRVTKGLRERLRFSDLIRSIEREVRKVRAMGLKPAVAVDIDGVIVFTRGFAAKIVKEWVETYERPRADEIRSLVAEKGVKGCWNAETVLKSIGITDEEIVANAMEYFDKNFKDPARRLEMEPIEGMVKLVKLLKKMGVEIVYTTARSPKVDQLEDGRSASEVLLSKFGIEGKLLRSEKESDWSIEAYKKGGNEPNKWEMVKGYRGKNKDVYFVAVIDNDPTHSAGYRRYFRYGIINIHVEGDLPPHYVPLQSGVFNVKPDQLKRDVEQWEGEARVKGNELAQDLMRRISMMRRSLTSPIFSSDRLRLDKAMERDARSAKQILENVAALGRWNPKHEAFLEALNTELGDLAFSFYQFEGAVRAVNRYTNSSFALLRGAGGIQRVVLARGEDHFDDGVIEPAPESFAPPNLAEMIGLEIDDSFRERVMAEPAGPVLAELSASEQYDLLSFAEYPRMNAALSGVIAAIGERKGDGGIVSVEHSPGISLAPMLALAASGVDVKWKESDPALRYLTMKELSRVPSDLRSKIEYVEDETPVEADLVVLNMPRGEPEQVASRMKRDATFGGVMVVQGRHEAVEIMERSPECGLLASAGLYEGDYVLPTTHVHASVAGAPLFFHAFTLGAI